MARRNRSNPPESERPPRRAVIACPGCGKRCTVPAPFPGWFECEGCARNIFWREVESTAQRVADPGTATTTRPKDAPSDTVSPQELPELTEDEMAEMARRITEEMDADPLTPPPKAPPPEGEDDEDDIPF